MPVPGRGTDRKWELTEQSFLYIPLIAPLFGSVQGFGLIKHLPYNKQDILLMFKILHNIHKKGIDSFFYEFPMMRIFFCIVRASAQTLKRLFSPFTRSV